MSRRVAVTFRLRPLTRMSWNRSSAAKNGLILALQCRLACVLDGSMTCQQAVSDIVTAAAAAAAAEVASDTMSIQPTTHNAPTSQYCMHLSFLRSSLSLSDYSRHGRLLLDYSAFVFFPRFLSILQQLLGPV